MKAIGAGKMSAGAAQLLGFLVHQVIKVIQGAIPYIIGQNHRRLVGGGEHHRIEEFPGGEGVPPIQATQRDAAVLGVFLAHHHFQIGLEGDFGAIQVVDVFQHHDGRHDLGQRSGIHLRIGVFFIDHVAGVQVDQIDRLGLDVEQGLILGIGGDGGKEQADDQKQGEKTKFFHGMGTSLP